MDVSTPMNSFDKKWLFFGKEEEKSDNLLLSTRMNFVETKMKSASRKNTQIS